MISREDKLFTRYTYSLEINSLSHPSHFQDQRNFFDDSIKWLALGGSYGYRSTRVYETIHIARELLLLFKTNCIRCQFRLGVVVQISGNSSAELGFVVYFTVLGACYPIEKAAAHDHPQLKAISFKFITCARPGGWMDAAAVGEDH